MWKSHGSLIIINTLKYVLMYIYMYVCINVCINVHKYEHENIEYEWGCETPKCMQFIWNE